MRFLISFLFEYQPVDSSSIQSSNIEIDFFSFFHIAVVLLHGDKAMRCNSTVCELDCICVY